MAENEIRRGLRWVHDSSGRVSGIRGERPTSVFQIGIPDVGLVAFEIPTEAECMLSMCPRGIVPDVARVADEFCVRKISDRKEIANAEASDAPLGLWKLEDGRSEIGHLRNLAALAAIGGLSHDIHYNVVHETRSENRSVSHRIILALYR